MPNASLIVFQEFLSLKIRKYTLDETNLLLTGAFLRYTDLIIDVSVYTGHDTKLQQIW